LTWQYDVTIGTIAENRKFWEIKNETLNIYKDQKHIYPNIYD
jgi:hypothetical protein